MTQEDRELILKIARHFFGKIPKKNRGNITFS